MATASIYGGAADGYLYKSASAWASVPAATPTAYTTQNTIPVVRTYVAGPWYTLGRAYLCFDVSELAGATINSASIRFNASGGTAGTRQSRLYYKDWGDELAAGDWSSSLGTAASDAFTPSTSWGQFTVTLTNVASILTANGRFEMVMTDESTTPAEQNYWDFWSGTVTNTDAQKPLLTIDYDLPVSQTLRDTYGIGGPIGQTVTDTYDILTPVAQTLQDTYNILTPVAQTLQDTYDLKTFVSQTLQDTYDLATPVSQTLQDTYSVATLVSQTLKDTYDLAGYVSQTLQDTYNVSALVSQTLQDTYNVSALVSQTYQDTYGIGGPIGQTVTDTYDILALVSQTLKDTYNVLVCVSQTLQDAYHVVNAGTISIERRTGAEGEWEEVHAGVWEDGDWTDTGPFVAGTTYYYRAQATIGGQTSGYSNVEEVNYLASGIVINAASTLTNHDLSLEVASTLSDTYNVATLVSQTLQDTYDVKASISQTYQDTYNIAALIAQTVRDTFNMGGLVAQTLTDTYGVGAYVSQTLKDTYNVLTLVSQTLQDTYNMEHSYDLYVPVSQTYQDTYGILTLISQTYQDTYNMGGFVAQTLQDTYNITAPSTGMAAMARISTATMKVNIATMKER